MILGEATLPEKGKESFTEELQRISTLRDECEFISLSNMELSLRSQVGGTSWKRKPELRFEGRRMAWKSMVTGK